MFYVRVKKVMTFHVHTHVHLHVGLSETPDLIEGDTLTREEQRQMLCAVWRTFFGPLLITRRGSYQLHHRVAGLKLLNGQMKEIRNIFFQKPFRLPLKTGLCMYWIKAELLLISVNFSYFGRHIADLCLWWVIFFENQT